MSVALAEPDSDPTDPRLGIGGNNPPLTPFEAIKLHIDDLYDEAKGFLDGEPITTQGQADAVTQLLEMIREATATADDLRKTENKPFDDGKAEVQARFAPLISDTKAVRGKTVLAAEACKAALQPWRVKVAAEKEAAAKLLRDEADAKAKAAAEALRATEATDLAAREAAEALVFDAKVAAMAANRAQTAAGKGNGLRDNFQPVMTDPVLAARWAWDRHRTEMEGFILSLAKGDVLAGSRALPGFEITNERRAV